MARCLKDLRTCETLLSWNGLQGILNKAATASRQAGDGYGERLAVRMGAWQRQCGQDLALARQMALHKHYALQRAAVSEARDLARTVEKKMEVASEEYADKAEDQEEKAKEIDTGFFKIKIGKKKGNSARARRYRGIANTFRTLESQARRLRTDNW